MLFALFIPGASIRAAITEKCYAWPSIRFTSAHHEIFPLPRTTDGQEIRADRCVSWNERFFRYFNTFFFSHAAKTEQCKVEQLLPYVFVLVFTFGEILDCWSPTRCNKSTRCWPPCRRFYGASAKRPKSSFRCPAMWCCFRTATHTSRTRSPNEWESMWIFCLFFFFQLQFLQISPTFLLNVGMSACVVRVHETGGLGDLSKAIFVLCT